MSFFSQGGFGGDGGKGETSVGTGTGGQGGDGGMGGTVSLTIGAGGPVAITSTEAFPGVVLSSTGGTGGAGGVGRTGSGEAEGHHGGAGGAGGGVTFNAIGPAAITTTDLFGLGADVIYALSQGGKGGNGGLASGTFSDSAAGHGEHGGNAGDVVVETTGSGTVTILTNSDISRGVDAQSLAGSGGDGGSGDDSVGQAEGGDGAGPPGVWTINLSATTSSDPSTSGLYGIVTKGDQSQGMFARSYGGSGGSGGNGSGGLGDGKGGAAAGPGPGGTVSVTLSGVITTFGDESNGILAPSVGGFCR
jgi:hypothetical protein